MSIWNDPDITFVDFAKYVSTESNKSALAQIWSDKTKHKHLLSQLQPYELSDVLIAFMTQCIKSKKPKSSPTPNQLHDASDLFTDWIIENKLSGIPSSGDADYTTMKLAVIFSKNLLSGWISEAAVPLKSYVDSQNEHKPSLSLQEIAAKNKKLCDMHPSLVHLFQQREQHKSAQKQQEARHSDVGYQVKKKCKVYKDEKLSEVLVELEKGELIGGKEENEKLGIVELVEPITGYVCSKHVKAYELDSSQWKFLQHQRPMTTNSPKERKRSITVYHQEKEVEQYQSAVQEKEREIQRLQQTLVTANCTLKQKEQERQAMEDEIAMLKSERRALHEKHEELYERLMQHMGISQNEIQSMMQQKLAAERAAAEKDTVVVVTQKDSELKQAELEKEMQSKVHELVEDKLQFLLQAAEQKLQEHEEEDELQEAENPFEKYASYFASKFPLEASIASYYALIMFLTAMVFYDDHACSLSDVIVSVLAFALFLCIPMIYEVYRYWIQRNNARTMDERQQLKAEAAKSIVMKLVILSVLMMTIDLRPFGCYVPELPLQISVIVVGIFFFIVHAIITKLQDQATTE